MKKLTIAGAVTVIGVLVFSVGMTRVMAANPAPAPGATAPGAIAQGKKFSFTVTELNNARRMTPAKPQLLLSWETRVRLANDALARDGATLKTTVDDVLARANKKAVDCSGKDYSLADLQALCQPSESAQACLDRLRMNCIVGQASQQMADSLANAFAAGTAKTAIDRMRNELNALENALFQK
jgi:hypothetical protein